MQVNHQIHKTQTMIETLQARLQDLANVAAKHKGISLAELTNRTLEQIASIENWRTRILRLCIVRRRSQRRCKWSMDDQGLWSLGPDDYHRQIRHHGPISSVSLVIGMNIGIDHFLDLGLVSQESQFWRYVHPKDTSGPEKESQQFKLRSGLMICGGKYGRKWPKTLNEKQGRKNPAGRCTTIDSCFFLKIFARLPRIWHSYRECKEKFGTCAEAQLGGTSSTKEENPNALLAHKTDLMPMNLKNDVSTKAANERT